MKNSFYNTTGILMFCWYCGFRWTYCCKETWLLNPINLVTAFLAISFILPTLFTINSTFKKYFLWLSIFLLFRNFYYTVEDVIDFRHFPSTRQAVYVIIDMIMFFYVFIWEIKYIKRRKER